MNFRGFYYNDGCLVMFSLAHSSSWWYNYVRTAQFSILTFMNTPTMQAFTQSLPELSFLALQSGAVKNEFSDKRNDFNFPIVNFPFICSNIQAALPSGVYSLQLKLCSRACGSYQDFLDRGLLPTRKQLSQWFLLVMLNSSLRQFYGRQHDLVDRYGMSVSHMTADVFNLS